MPIGIALVVTLAALHHLMLRIEALRTGIRAHGLVVATLPVRGASRTFDAPLVRFVDHEGRERHFRLVAGRLIAPRVGSTVEILYLRSDPAQAFVSSFAGLWLSVLAWATVEAALWVVLFMIVR